MVCVQCGSKTQIYNTRQQKRTNQVWRRRECLNCHMTFTTEESINYEGTWRVKYPNGSLEPFLRDKLFVSVLRSCQHRTTALSDAQGLTETIIKKMLSQVSDGAIDTATILKITQVALNRFDTAASVHYQAHHQS